MTASLVASVLKAGLIIWLALLMAIVIGRLLRGSISLRGILAEHPAKAGSETYAPRAIAMLVFPLVIMMLILSALNFDPNDVARCASVVPKYPGQSRHPADGRQWRLPRRKTERFYGWQGSWKMTASHLALWSFVVLSAILLAFALIVLGKIWKGTIKLDDLLSEEGPGPQKASLARFQFLLFTFVIAGLYLLLSIEAGTFVDIPVNVLALLGISGGSYVLSSWFRPAAH